MPIVDLISTKTCITFNSIEKNPCIILAQNPSIIVYLACLKRVARGKDPGSFGPIVVQEGIWDGESIVSPTCRDDMCQGSLIVR